METYFQNLTREEVTKEKFVRDVVALARDAEGLVKAAGANAAEKTRQEFTASLARIKDSCRNIERRTSAGAVAADQIIRAHPYPSLGLAFGVGILLGVLVSRK